MKKYLLLLAVTLLASFNASASYIEHVNGADMAGIEVTVFYTDGGTETVTWEAISETDGGAFSGESGWSLVLYGDSFGQMDDEGNLYGVFELFTGRYSLAGFMIDMLDAGFVFDIEYGDESANGSDDGREFVTDYVADDYLLAYSDWVEDELFGTLSFFSVSEIEASTSMMFMTDTDGVAEDVPAPAGLMLIALGMLGLRLVRRNK